MKLLLLITLSITILVFNGCTNKTAERQTNITKQQLNSDLSQMSKVQIKADKIEVVHFHATQQCWSCTTVGQYAIETIKERFPDEYKNSTIVFKDINIELPANKEIINKYQAGGASLFVDAISDSKDNIEEDATVWRLVTDEVKFKDYFENKLKKLIGK